MIKAVDFDATLARYNGWNNGELGEPVREMVERVKRWLKDGEKVVIFTARVSVTGAYSMESHSYADQTFADEQRALIEQWCLKHIGQILPVTAIKQFDFTEIWDDRAVPVIPNIGKVGLKL